VLTPPYWRDGEWFGGGVALVAALVEPETMQVATAAMALAAAIATVGLVVARVLAGVSPRLAAAGRWATDRRNELTFVVAAAATLGSLYFSESAHYVPCRLCWFQRVAMYPIAVVALVGLVRGDRAARWYALALAAVGAPISAYHYLIEWKPGLDTGACELFGPACTDIWFRTFGFATLAFMALCGFLAIIAVNTISFPPTRTSPETP
jgi:disulfide bond formation protein DsbB